MTPRPDVSAERTAQIVESRDSGIQPAGLSQSTHGRHRARGRRQQGHVVLVFREQGRHYQEALLQHLFEQEVQEVTTVLAAEGSVSERLLALTQQLAGRLEEQREADSNHPRVLRDGNPRPDGAAHVGRLHPSLPRTARRAHSAGH